MLSNAFKLEFQQKLMQKLIAIGLPAASAEKIAPLLEPTRTVDQVLYLKCADPFYHDQIFSPQKELLDSLAVEFLGEGFATEWEGKTRKKNKKADASPAADMPQPPPPPPNGLLFAEPVPPPAPASPSKGRSLEKDYSFSNFVRGESNLAAFTACEAVSRNPGTNSNPLFIYGATGLGKTHLLQAVGNDILARKPDMQILYVSSHDFINDVIHRGIKAGKMQEVRRKYNSCDVLLVDDVQFLENKDACQLEFFYTFNELYQKHKQIIMTCDKFPKDIPHIEERLKSRFLQGLLVDIEPPGFEDRVAIIESKSKKLGIKLNQDVCFCIATHAKTNVREIEGLLKDLLVHKHMTGQDPTLDSVNQALRRRFPATRQDLDVSHIQKIVAQHFQLKISDLLGPGRQKQLVMARHTAMYLAKDLLQMQVLDISQSFGKRDHTTALHALTKVRQLMESNPEYRAEYLTIKKKLEQ